MVISLNFFTLSVNTTVDGRRLDEQYHTTQKSHGFPTVFKVSSLDSDSLFAYCDWLCRCRTALRLEHSTLKEYYYEKLHRTQIRLGCQRFCQ